VSREFSAGSDHVNIKINSTDNNAFRNLAGWFMDFVWPRYNTLELLPSPILVTRAGGHGVLPWS
jgi:hypothetical protein